VNGLDFWNNSYDIPADKKHLYGTVKFGKITSMQSGAIGKLSYDAAWHDQSGKTHLTEQTGFEFSEINGVWVIDRTTTLTAAIPVVFKDNKEGVLGLRMAHELQIPAKTTKKFVDANGIETTIKAVTDTIANGNYINGNELTDQIRNPRDAEDIDYQQLTVAQVFDETAASLLEKRELLETYRSMIRQVLDQLSPAHSQIIRMSLDEDKTYKVIAEELGIPIGTVMSRLFFARKKAQELIIQYATRYAIQLDCLGRRE
jgi:RNA polymerase sigma factor (sigma-70 family)